jgi:hypothetical protein
MMGALAAAICYNGERPDGAGNTATIGFFV